VVTQNQWYTSSVAGCFRFLLMSRLSWIGVSTSLCQRASTPTMAATTHISPSPAAVPLVRIQCVESYF
jgi:hypothetical protein